MVRALKSKRGFGLTPFKDGFSKDILKVSMAPAVKVVPALETLMAHSCAIEA